ncbi:MAG: ribosomal protein L7/L12 [Candidatus Omnitrophica bacterium]|nr:ribosomal protein L7/L12 [Candidatus Omnitrophota bacterium]
MCPLKIIMDRRNICNAVVFLVVVLITLGCYQPAAPLPADEEVRALMKEGRKIAAIKRYREIHGVGLAEAKAAVEDLENN